MFKKLLFILPVFISFFCIANRSKDPSGNDAIKNSQNICFTENKGQVYDQNFLPRPDVLFAGQANSMIFHLRNDGISYQLFKVNTWKYETDIKTLQKKKVADKTTIYRLDLDLINCNTKAQIEKENSLPGSDNYYLHVCPNGIRDVKSYGEITYKNIYKGIDLKWYHKEKNLKYDYIVKAGADYKQIQLEINGAEKINLNAKGELIIKTPLGKIIEQAPVVKQNGRILKSRWVIKNKTVSFEISGIDSNSSFIIDPCVRVWGTYYGGGGDEEGRACTTDMNGNVYLTGFSNSNLSPAIATTGAHQITYGGGNFDSFLVKFNAAGVRQWSTFYGGNGDDKSFSCATDANGNVYLAGYTTSLSVTGIATAASHQPAYGGDACDAFLVQFNSAGVRQWATYYGGSSTDYGLYCSTDLNNNVYLCGFTSSSDAGAIATPGSHQTTFNNQQDCFLVKFNSAGTRQWGTYYGGAQGDVATACATDAAGNIFLYGYTQSNIGNIIATPGSHQPIYGTGFRDAFLAKFSSSGIRLWGTYYGGYQEDIGSGCATDASGNIYICGFTQSPNAMSTLGSHQPAFGNGFGWDGYLAKFDGTGARLWGTYYGSMQYDDAISCAVDSNGNVFIAGQTDTNTGTAIATTGSHQPLFGGGLNDAYLAKFNPSGVRLWGTYYGGLLDEIPYGCSADANGNAHLTGFTTSNNGTTIATPGSHQPTVGGSKDAFLVGFFDCSPPTPVNITPLANQNICVNSLTSLSVTGTGTLNWYSGLTSTNTINTGASYNTAILSAAGVYTYYAAATTTCGEGNRVAITVTVNAYPVVTVNSGSVCSGKSFTIVPGGATSYTFEGGSAIVTPTSNISYTVTGSIAGCISQSFATSTITVHATPTITVNSGTICSGTSFSIIPTGANTYTFQGGNAVVSPTTNTTYSVTGTSSAGCVSSLAAISTISVNPSPLILVNSGSICAGQSFTISATGANTYTYETGSAVISPTVTGSYTVTGTNLLGCISSSAAVANITVNALPTINVSTSNALLCVGQTSTLTANGANTYTWNPGGPAISITVSPVVNTTYLVTGSNVAGCINNSAFTQSVSVCTKTEMTQTINSEITVYPNPFSDKIIVCIDSLGTQVQLFNALGSLLFSNKIENKKTVFDLSEWASGIYFIQIGSEVKKIIKE